MDVSRPATADQIGQVRTWLIWFRDAGCTYSMLEADLKKSGGWCNKVINDRGRYKVTRIDWLVIRASYLSALRLYRRDQHKYLLMQQIIVGAGDIMRNVELLAESA